VSEPPEAGDATFECQILFCAGKPAYESLLQAPEPLVDTEDRCRQGMELFSDGRRRGNVVLANGTN